MDRFDLAAQGVHTGLWDWDLTTSRIHYSPGWVSLLGCAGAEFGNTVEEWFRRIHSEDFTSVQSEINNRLAQGSTQFEIRHRMLHQDGCYRWMSCQGVITRDNTGRAIRVTGHHVDITAEKVVDPLTGLPNRILLMDRLARSIQKTRKSESFVYAVLIIDLDLFESGIDRLDTVNADSLIVAAARRMESALRTDDGAASNHKSAHLVARFVGEEFIVLLEGLSALDEAKKTADRLLKEILAPFEFNDREVFLSPSIGIALSATGYQTAEQVLRDADTALYRAKAFGKSCCEVFDTAVLELSRSRDQLEKDLEEALGRNEFLMFYQPILSLSTNRIVGFEALVRWKHRSRGLVAPAEFIPIAEKNGLIIPLSRWILQQACTQLKIWKQDLGIAKELWVSVNLSGKQFMQPSLAKEISGILLDLDLDAGGLVLELTESAVIMNPEAAQTLLMQLRVLGARVALDDFGTGYSSLSHLRQFPLDFLKMDSSFVKSIETGADAMEIVRTITTLARQLGLRVIAEGIENPRQLDLLRSLQCEYGQGFLFSKAVDGGEAKTLLLNSLTPGEEESASTPPPEISVSEDELENPPAAPESQTRRKISSNRKYILWALPAVIPAILGSLMARLNLLPSIHASHNSPPALVSGTEKITKPAPWTATAEKVPAPEMQKTVPAAISPESTTPVVPAGPGKKDVPVLKAEKTSTAASAPKSSKTAAVQKPAPKEARAPQDQKEQPVAAKLPDSETMPDRAQKGAQISSTQNESPAAAVAAPAALPKTEREATTITVYRLPVVHDHVLGSCRGMLTFDRDGISFVSQKAKDSFYFKYPDFSYTLDGDRLTIKAGSAVFRFKSSTALDKAENRSQLFDFYQGISKLYEEPSSKKAARGR